MVEKCPMAPAGEMCAIRPLPPARPAAVPPASLAFQDELHTEVHLPAPTYVVVRTCLTLALTLTPILVLMLAPTLPLSISLTLTMSLTLTLSQTHASTASRTAWFGHN